MNIIFKRDGKSYYSNVKLDNGTSRYTIIPRRGKFDLVVRYDDDTHWKVAYLKSFGVCKAIVELIH